MKTKITIKYIISVFVVVSALALIPFLDHTNAQVPSAPGGGVNKVTCYEVLGHCGPENYDVYFCNGCISKMCSSYNTQKQCVVSGISID
jgi:hypothetical protein